MNKPSIIARICFGWLMGVLTMVAAFAHAAPLSIAVLGDSDSHGYADTTWFAAGSDLRGGKYRAHTLQWTEVLAALRPQQVDLGERSAWGLRQWQVKFFRTLGLPFRFPRKLDHRFNFAWTGATCDALLTGDLRQAERLRDEMSREPGRWTGGVVVVRIGINDLGTKDMLDRMARDAQDRQALQAVNACAAAIEQSVALIRQAHPGVRFVLVGVLDNADWPPYFGDWQSAAALANIRTHLDRFDQRLRELAAQDALQRVFIGDRQWFAGHWGRRGADGKPAYRAVQLPGLPPIAHAQGDAPTHTVLGDGHLGLAANALWAQALVGHLNRGFGAQIAPITDAEIAALVRTALASVK
jgi:lysophospholipase L1-like esterase